MHPGWSIIIPVKPLTSAKSRLASLPVSPDQLARAFLIDVLNAVTLVPRVRRVVVASSDPEVASIASLAGALFVDDSGRQGINAGAQLARGHRVEGTAVGVLVSDLPWLTPASLDAALALGEDHKCSFIADADDTGTTLWMASPHHRGDSHFGPESRRRHRDAGSTDLVLEKDVDARLQPLRRDVDTPEGLQRTSGLRMGKSTALLIPRMHLPFAAGARA